MNKQKENYSILREPLVKFFRGKNFDFLGTATTNPDHVGNAMITVHVIMVAESCSVTRLLNFSFFHLVTAPLPVSTIRPCTRRYQNNQAFTNILKSSSTGSIG
jgi:hypothetical protein